MDQTKRFYWLAQLIGWLAYCGILMLSVYTDNPARINSIFILNLTILYFLGIFTTHIQRVIFIHLGWLKLRLPRLIPRLILSSILSAFFISSIDVLTDYFTDPHFKLMTISNIIAIVISAIILVLFWNAIYFTFHFFKKSRLQEISNLELMATNKESELKNLRSQLNPHFLFNSLYSIRALIELDPEKAKSSVTTLSNLLRQSLILGKEKLITLEEELKLAKNYLDLEKIRFEERLEVRWHIENELLSFEIPPFSLQMLVENAIKHGISNLQSGGIIEIYGLRKNNEILIEVCNTGEIIDKKEVGIGIENINKRLKYQFGDRFSFRLYEGGNQVHAEIVIKDEEI